MATGMTADVASLGGPAGAVDVKSIALKMPSFVDAAESFGEVDQVVRGEMVSSGDTVAQYTFYLLQPPLMPQQFG